MRSQHETCMLKNIRRFTIFVVGVSLKLQNKICRKNCEVEEINYDCSVIKQARLFKVRIEIRTWKGL